MESETPEESAARYAEAIEQLRPAGFVPVGNWRFTKNGVTYDLSAANLDMIDRIEREGLCVVPEPESAKWLADKSLVYQLNDAGENHVVAFFQCNDRTLDGDDLADIASRAAEAMNAHDDLLTLVNSSILRDLFGLIEDSETPEAARLFPFVQAWVAMRDGILKEQANA